MPSYLLRIELVDRPGSLGTLAVALGSVGADILSLDVVERSGGYAIDDLVIELPTGAMPDRLITAAESLSGVRVDSLRPHTGLLEAHRELELLDRVAAAPDVAAKLRVLADEAPRVLRVSWCTVLRSSSEGLQ
ncbi:MAG: amino acid-binding protein, partial [Mycobacterium sp.]|nr:amino acid-binding protein [Mycobacterium sp.]